MASLLRKLLALLCLVVPLLPIGGLYADDHHCACGMSKNSCFCELIAAHSGARCGMGMPGEGGCMVRSSRSLGGAILLVVSLDLHGWLRMHPLPLPALAATGWIAPALHPFPLALFHAPELPPPRSFPSA